MRNLVMIIYHSVLAAMQLPSSLDKRTDKIHLEYYL
jgi:hypothetical protein